MFVIHNINYLCRSRLFYSGASFCLFFCAISFFGPIALAQTVLAGNTPVFEITGGNSAGPLTINRIELTFNNGLPQATVEIGQAITASAAINFSGNGLFSALWRLDDQIIEQVSIPVSSGSNLKIRLSESTYLPTFQAGEHVLSLEVQTPATSLAIPRIRYFVVAVAKKRATLFSRPLGSESWQHRPLTIEPGGRVELRIPSELLVTPGLEYYVEIISADGKRVTDPVDKPALKPHQIKIGAEESEGLIYIRGKTQGRSPTAPIQIVLDKQKINQLQAGSLRLMLDDMDVTGLVDIVNDSIMFTPSAPLPAGRHMLIVSSGNLDEKLPPAEMSFTVAEGPKSGKSNTLYARGNMAFQYGVNGSSDGENTNANGNIALAFGGNYGNTDYSWNGININYDKDASSPWDLASGFTFTANNGGKQFEYGDISISESALTVSGFSRRGLKARIVDEHSQMQFFVVGSEQVSGFHSGLSSGSDNQVFGASYASDSGSDSPLNFKLIALMGENAGEFGESVASTASPAKGETIGVQADSKIGETWVGLDVGVSSYDADVQDAIGAETDVAVSVAVKRKIFSSQLSASLLHYGADYATIANPNFSGDRQGGTLGLSTTMGPAALTLQLSNTEDNVSNDKDRPTVTSNGLNASLSLAWPEWPRLSFGFNQSNLQSSNEPDAQSAVNNTNQSFSAGISHGSESWRAALTTSFAKLDDRLLSNNDSTTESYSLTGGFQNNQGNVNATLSTSISESADIENKSTIVGLNTSMTLIPEELTLNANANLQRAIASNNSVDNESKNIGLVMNYNGSKLFKRLQKSFGGNVQLSLSMNYRQQSNAIDATETDDFTVFLSFGFGMPLHFQNEWQ